LAEIEGAVIAPIAPDPSTPVQTAAPGGLHRQLSAFAVLLLTLSCLSPVVSIFGVGADVLQHTGGGAATLFLLGIGAAVIWGLVYAELGSAFPYAGGDYVGVGTILGPWAGLATLAMWVVITPPSIAFSARTFAVYMGGLTPGIPGQAIVFGGLAGCVAVSLMSVRSGAWITGLFLALETAAVLALLAVGLSHPSQNLIAVMSHPMAPGLGGALGPVAFGALAIAGVNTVYATVGGNQAIAFGEELTDPHRRMGPVVLLAPSAAAWPSARR
jgi:amino acid transporter